MCLGYGLKGGFVALGQFCFALQNLRTLAGKLQLLGDRCLFGLDSGVKCSNPILEGELLIFYEEPVFGDDFVGLRTHREELTLGHFKVVLLAGKVSGGQRSLSGLLGVIGGGLCALC